MEDVNADVLALLAAFKGHEHVQLPPPRVVADSLSRVTELEPSLLAVCLSAAVALVRDADAGVVKRSLLAAVSLLRAAFIRATRDDAATQPDTQTCWTAARALCSEACLLASRGTSDGVRLQAIKLVEAAVMMFTAALGTEGDAAGVAAGIVPLLFSRGGFLQSFELNRNLRECLGA